jgi:hypothetical protein
MGVLDKHHIFRAGIIGYNNYPLGVFVVFDKKTGPADICLCQFAVRIKIYIAGIPLAGGNNNYLGT